MQISLKTRGRLLGATTAEERNNIYTDINNKIRDEVQTVVTNAFNRSTQLAAFVGQAPEMDILTILLRSLKVNLLPTRPARLQIKFQDDLAHLYGGEEFPEEVIKTIQSIVDKAIEEWFNSPRPKELIVEVLSS